MQSKLSLLIGLLTVSIFAVAQKVDSTQLKNSHKPKLMLDIMLIDAPYIKYSGQARANYKASVSISQSAETTFGDYAISAFEAPSMSQVISYSSSFYNTMNYGIAKGWNKIPNGF